MKKIILFVLLVILFLLLGKLIESDEKKLIISHIDNCVESTDLSDSNGLTFQGGCLVGIRGFVKNINKNESIKIELPADGDSNKDTLEVFYDSSFSIYKMNCGVDQPCQVGATKQDVDINSNYLTENDYVQLSSISSIGSKVIFSRMIIMGNSNNE